MSQLPNLITGVRILLTPWIVVALLRGDCRTALWVSLIAGSTDYVDGYAARRLGVSSRSGAYLDPIADKILLTSLYVCFGIADLIPDWLVWLVVGRDVLILTMVAVGLLFTTVRDYPPTFAGKLSTFLQIVTSVAILSRCAYPGVVPSLLHMGFIAATTVATTWSGFQYVWRAITTWQGEAHTIET